MEFKVLEAKAKQRGIEEIEIYEVKTNGLEMTCFDGEIEQNTTSMTHVFCIRGVYNHQLATVYTEKDDEESMDFVLDTIIRNAKMITKDEPYFIYGGDETYPVALEKQTDFETVSLADKVKICQQVDALLKKKCPYVYKTEVSYAESMTACHIQNNNHLNVSKENKRAYIVAELIVKKDDDVKTAYDYLLFHQMAELDLEAFTDKIIEDAVGQFGAESVLSGDYDIVLDRSTVRSLLQVYSSVFFATSVLKKMSFLEGKIGEKVFGDNITLIDDPLHPLAQSFDTFDDEGVATKTKTVVENGVLKTYLHNLSTAKQMDVTSTGNGFKADINSPVSVQIDNFYLKPGTLTKEELFASVGNGLYITDLEGLHAGVNLISGTYSLKASGYKITDGKKADPVTLIILSSSFQDTFNKVFLLADDFEFRGSVGACSIVLRNMPVSGK